MIQISRFKGLKRRRFLFISRCLHFKGRCAASVVLLIWVSSQSIYYIRVTFNIHIACAVCITPQHRIRCGNSPLAVAFSSVDFPHFDWHTTTGNWGVYTWRINLILCPTCLHCGRIAPSIGIVTCSQRVSLSCTDRTGLTLWHIRWLRSWVCRGGSLYNIFLWCIGNGLLCHLTGTTSAPETCSTF